jgi:ribonuclease HII
MPRRLDLGEEHLRLEKMKEYEHGYPDDCLICGVDEAGRGPLAGPVSAGAVILPRDAEIIYLNDSKKLSEKRREELYDRIRECAIAWNVAVADHVTIDRINILQADYQAMRDAVEGLSIKPQVLFNDAVIIPGLDMEQVKLIHGDALSVSIAAASIMAKVTRDRLMYQYDEIYPEYGFARNKGYGTAEHIAAIKKYGPCPIHRMTFIRKFIDA